MVYIIKVRGLTSSLPVGMWIPLKTGRVSPYQDWYRLRSSGFLVKFPHFTGTGRGHVNHERYRMSRVQLQRYVFFHIQQQKHSFVSNFIKKDSLKTVEHLFLFSSVKPAFTIFIASIPTLPHYWNARFIGVSGWKGYFRTKKWPHNNSHNGYVSGKIPMAPTTGQTHSN